MADPRTKLRSFILADFPELAAFFDNSYGYCGDASHNHYNDYGCSYPDKALVVDEKLQRASLVHIINGWSYHTGCHMRGLGVSAWETILKAIKEQDEACGQAKENDRSVGNPDQVYSQSRIEARCRPKGETPATAAPVQEPQSKSVITQGLRQLHEAINKSTLLTQTPQPETTNQPTKFPPATRTLPPAPSPAPYPAPYPGLQERFQPFTLPQTGEKRREFFCDLFKKLDIAETNESTINEPYQPPTNIPTSIPPSSFIKQDSAKGSCQPSIDDLRRWKLAEGRLKSAAFDHCKALATTNPSTLSSALAKQDQNVEKEWEFVQDDSLKEDYLMVWPGPGPKPEDNEWEVVQPDSVEEDHVMVWP